MAIWKPPVEASYPFQSRSSTVLQDIPLANGFLDPALWKVWDGRMWQSHDFVVCGFLEMECLKLTRLNS